MFYLTKIKSKLPTSGSVLGTVLYITRRTFRRRYLPWETKWHGIGTGMDYYYSLSQARITSRNTAKLQLLTTMATKYWSLRMSHWISVALHICPSGPREGLRLRPWWKPYNTQQLGRNQTIKTMSVVTWCTFYPLSRFGCVAQASILDID